MAVIENHRIRTLKMLLRYHMLAVEFNLRLLKSGISENHHGDDIEEIIKGHESEISRINEEIGKNLEV